MQEFIQFYKAFLSNREIKEFDGRILCRYQMSDQEFVQLEGLLQKVNLSDQKNIKTIIAPLLVLYTSESWRRNFTGAHWSWTVVLQSLNQGNLNNLRYKYLEKGFSFLKRDLRITETGIRYLGSIAIESGIPVHILQNQNNGLKSVIESVYKKLENSVSNINPIDLVKNIAGNRLPETYHNDRFFLLILDFSSSLLALNRKYSLENHQNPMSFLNQTHPEWKDELPIVLTGENESFFNTLLSDVAEITRTIQNKLKVNYFLKSNNDIYSLHYNVKLKSGIYSHEVLGINTEQFSLLPNRFILAKNQGDSIVHLGYFDKVGNGQKFRIENLSGNTLAVSFIEDVDYFLTDFEDNLKVNLNLNVIDFKNNVAPLVFVPDNESLKLKAVGSSKFKECTYKVIIPKESVIGSGDVLKFNDENHQLFEVNKNVCITNQDECKFEISFSETSDCNRFEWYRTTDAIGFYENENKLIFIGCPDLLKYNNKGSFLRRYNSNDLEVYINKKWSSIDNHFCGRVKVRLIVNGITEFSSWVNLLPENFAFNYKQSSKKIVLENLSTNVDIEVENKDFKITSNTLSYQENDKGFTKLRLKSHVLDKPVAIKLPLPVPETYFSKQGEVLDKNSNISINQLKGIKLCWLNLSNRKVKRTISIVLHARNIRVYKKYFVSPFCSRDVSLISLRDELVSMFAVDNLSDTIINVRSDDQIINVKKYQSAPYFNQEVKSYKFPVNNRKVQAFRLDQDFKESGVIDIKVDEEGYLETEPIEGLWFLYSPDESENYFRPVALYKKFQAVDFDENTDFSDWDFKDISKIHNKEDGQKGYEIRRKAIKQRLKKVAYDFSHPEWENNLIPLSEYFKNTDMTLSSLELWKHGEHSDAVKASMFFFLDQDFIYQMSNEFSIVWRRIAISKWQKSFNAFKSYYTQIFGDNKNLITTIIDQKLQLLENFELEGVKSILLGQTEEVSSPLLLAILPNELNALRLRHVDQNWFDSINNRVSGWFRQCQLNTELDSALLNLLNAGNQFEYSIKYFPVVLAYASVYRVNLEDLETATVKYEVLKIREFDLDWYKQSYSIFQAYFYTQQQNNGAN